MPSEHNTFSDRRFAGRPGGTAIAEHNPYAA
jgi:hypothetical protein